MPEKNHGGRPKGLAKTGGRVKGVPNKRTVEVMEKLAALGCDPIEGMARIANDMANTPELRGRMFSELAQYVAPKRKAVDIAGPNGGPIEGRVEVVIRPI